MDTDIGAQLKKELVDELIRKNSERKTRFPVWIFHPLEPIRLRWDIGISMAMFYVLINIPIQIAFEVSLPKHHPWSLVNFSVDLFFICDIFVNFNTGLITESGFITSRREISRQYLTGWFFMDTITSIPFDQIDLPGNSKISVLSKLMKIFRILRLLKLIRMIRLLKVMNNWESSDDGNVALTRIIKFLVIMFITAHTAACFWVGIANHYRSSDRSEENFRGWNEESWIVRFQDSWSKSIYEIYLRALYWAFTTLTTVGYGDITPVMPLEVGYTISIQIIGSTIFGYIIGNVASLMASSDETVLMIQSKMQAVQAYMKHRKIPPDLANKIKSHYAYSWKQSQLFKEEEILGELPNPLRIQCALFMHKDLIGKVDFFSMLEDDDVPGLVSCLLPMFSGPGDAVISEGLFGSEMYVISKGTLETSVEFINFASHSKSKINVETLKEGDYFADYAIIMDQAKHPLTVLSTGFCDMFHLGRKDFVEYADHYPVAVLQIIKLCKNRYIELTKKITKKRDTMIMAVNRIIWHLGLAHANDPAKRLESQEDEQGKRLSAVIKRAQVTTVALRWKYRQHLLHALNEAKKAASEEQALTATTGSFSEEPLRADESNPLQSPNVEDHSSRLNTFRHLMNAASGLGLKQKTNLEDVVGHAMGVRVVEHTIRQRSHSMRNLVFSKKIAQHEVIAKQEKEIEDADLLPKFFPVVMQKILSWKNRCLLRVAIRSLNNVERRHRNKFHLDQHFQGDDKIETGHLSMRNRFNSTMQCNCQGLQEDMNLMESAMKDEFKKINDLILNLSQKIDAREARFSFPGLSRNKRVSENGSNQHAFRGEQFSNDNKLELQGYNFVEKECNCHVS